MATIKNLTSPVYFKPLSLVLGLVLVANIAAALLVPSGEAWAAKKAKKAAPNNKYASLVMDAGTGEILSQENPDKRLHPASLTKVMTLLMLFEAIETGKTSLNDRIRISKHAANMAPSKLGLPAGSSIKVKDAIYALVTKSANDISAAIGEHLAGSESGFARKMTARAHEIGMTSSTFVNASGLHDPRQVSTARDMAKMARFVIVQYPEYYRYFSTVNFKYNGKNYHNHNRLMESYRGMDGMKTGYTNPSGFNLVASAVRGDRRLIGVVFGGRSTKSRNDHMAQLLDRGFATKSDLRIADARANVPPRAPAGQQDPNMRALQQMQMAAVPPAQVAAPEALSAYKIAENTPSGSVPLPPRKPLLASAAGAVAAVLQPEGLTSSDKEAAPVAIASADAPVLKPPMEAGFDGLIGEGDFDPAVYKRIEAGLSAIAAHKGGEAKSGDLHRVLTAAQKQNPNSGVAKITNASYQPPQKMSGSNPWSVQIGAFTSRAATDQAIQRVLKQIPAPYSQAQPMIAPLKTASGWLFRGRLTGFTRTEALAACNYIRDCLPVAPQN